MKKLKVLEEFFDIKEEITRKVGSELDCEEKRAAKLIADKRNLVEEVNAGAGEGKETS